MANLSTATLTELRAHRSETIRRHSALTLTVDGCNCGGADGNDGEAHAMHLEAVRMISGMILEREIARGDDLTGGAIGFDGCDGIDDEPETTAPRIGLRWHAAGETSEGDVYILSTNGVESYRGTLLDMIDKAKSRYNVELEDIRVDRSTGGKIKESMQPQPPISPAHADPWVDIDPNDVLHGPAELGGAR